MIYNVWLEAELKSVSNFVQPGALYNITYNLGEMQSAAVGSTQSELDGLIANDLLPKLTVGIRKITFFPDDCRVYESLIKIYTRSIRMQQYVRNRWGCRGWLDIYSE